MLYFIPAWYKQNMWCENEQQWYKRRLKSEFDETIKQITLFHRNVDRPYTVSYTHLTLPTKRIV